MKITLELDESPHTGCSPEEHVRLLRQGVRQLQDRYGSAPSIMIHLADTIEREMLPEPKSFGAIVAVAGGGQWFRWTSASGGACWLRRGDYPNYSKAKSWAELGRVMKIVSPGPEADQ